jgi:uncharacterized protein (DUF1800 family)
VFTGWNLQRVGNALAGTAHLAFAYVPGQHDTGPKTFSFPIYPDGGRTIPSRSAADGMQDGIDFINGLAALPATGRYLARKLFRFFVSEFRPPDPAFVDRIAGVYLSSRYDMRAVMREVFLSSEFWDARSVWGRYAWPVEYVVRLLKDAGWTGFSVDSALAPLTNMGMTLFEPPDVAGWDAGQNWFSSGAMLARMNFASALAANQRFNLSVSSKSHAQTPESFLSYYTTALDMAPAGSAVRAEWLNYLMATGAWTGNDTQRVMKASGLVHLIGGSPEYQLQ